MLINCVAYQDGKSLADCPIERHQRVRASRPRCFVWVALKDATPRRARQKMQPASSTSTSSRSRTRTTVTSARRSRSTATRCSPCCTVEIDPPDERSIGEIDVFVGPNFVLRPATAPHRASSRCASAPRASRSSSCTARPSSSTRSSTRSSTATSRSWTRSRATLEALRGADLPSRTRRANIEWLYGAQAQDGGRQARRGAAREAIAKLIGGRVPQVAQRLRDYFRDVYDHLTRMSSAARRCATRSAPRSR